MKKVGKGILTRERMMTREGTLMGKGTRTLIKRRG